jgi:hypothetical protein
MIRDPETPQKWNRTDCCICPLIVRGDEVQCIVDFCSKPRDASQTIIYSVLSFTANKCGTLKFIYLVLEVYERSVFKICQRV